MKQKWNPTSRTLPACSVAEILADLTALDLDMERPMVERDLAELCLFNRLAVNNLLAGHGTPDSLGACITAMNLAALLCESGYGAEWIGVVRQAQEGVFRARLRGEKTGKWGFDGPAIAAVKEAFDVHEAQLEHASRQTLVDMIMLMNARIDEGEVFTTAMSES